MHPTLSPNEHHDASFDEFQEWRSGESSSPTSKSSAVAD